MTAAAPPPAGGPIPPTAPPPPSPPPGYAPYPAGAPPPTYMMPRRADFSNMISGTFDVWVKNFGPFFLVFLLLSLVTNGLSLAGSYLILRAPFVPGGIIPGTGPSTGDVAAYVLYEVVVAIITWVFTSMVLGGVVDFSIRHYRGENVRIMDSLSRGLGRVLSVMGANLLVTLITVGVIVLWVIVLLLGAFSAVSGNVGGALAAICGALIALPFVLFLVLYIDIALSLYAPVIMAEGSHAVDSLGRSWNLTKGHKWSIFAAGLILGIVAAVIGVAIGVVNAIAANPAVSLVITAIGAGITGAWFAILTSVAYDLIIKQPQASVWPPAYAPAYPPASPPR